jgi:cytochrome P450
MSTTEAPTTGQIPDDVARRIVTPEGHTDEPALYEAYRWLRENAPLAVADVEGYDPVWLVSKHADIMEIERNPATFSSAGGPDEPGGNNPILQNQAGDAFTKTLTGGSLRILDAIPYLDPPEHTRLKDVAVDWFRPANLKGYEGRIRESALEAIGELTEKDGEFDLIQDWLLAFPMHVIMTLFGVPREDEPQMHALSQEFFGTDDPDVEKPDVDVTPEAAAEQFANAIQGFYGYFDALVEDRRANPQDDLAGLIATAKVDGEYLSKGYCFGYFVAIATAGHDTTTTSIASGIDELLRRPDQLALVQDDPSQIGGLVNESIRWASPIKHFVRRAEQDAVISGQEIKKGDRLMLLYQSGNRDTDVFENPDEFDLTRRPNKHIAFGYGPHACIGQHVAKMEMRIFFEEFLPEIGTIEPAGPTKVAQSNFGGGLKKMPVRKTAG